MTTGEKVGIGVALLLLFWPWKESATVVIGPPTGYGNGNGGTPCTCDSDPLCCGTPYDTFVPPGLIWNPYPPDPFDEANCTLMSTVPCIPGNTYEGY